MIRGVRGATTVNYNDAKEILINTKLLVEDIIKSNQINPDDVASVLISVTPDINATFPAKSIRELEGWTYVPVMCMQEIAVPSSLEKCVRVMMTVNTLKSQPEIKHIYHYDAKKLRPDLVK